MTHFRLNWLQNAIGIVSILAVVCAFAATGTAWADAGNSQALVAASSLSADTSTNLTDKADSGYKNKLFSQKKRTGWIKENGTWTYYQSGKQLKNAWVVTDRHPIDKSKSGLDRYWIDANGVLAISRFINPKTSLDSNSEYVAYATPTGNVVRGKYIIGYGMILGNNDGKLYTRTRWLMTDQFDGTLERYRLVKKGICAVVKTGFFKVGGKKFYAWPDKRGYLMRSMSKYINGKWYKANEKGVLENTSDRTRSHVNSYVRWAKKIAKDDSHGYSQVNRWGPDYDCSSFVCSALLSVGFPDSGASWTGNMKSRLKRIGFVWHRGTKGLRKGDILLVHSNERQHTEIYIGNKQLVGAHSSENGTIDGESGDQTGNEISITGYYDAPWQGYLRYKR